MGIFLFKKGATLRLHDHPDMSVYTRCFAILYAGVSLRLRLATVT